MPRRVEIRGHSITVVEQVDVEFAEGAGSYWFRYSRKPTVVRYERDGEKVALDIQTGGSD